MSATRRIVSDMNSLLDKTVVVRLNNNRTYVGQLSAYELSPFIISLANAKDNDNNVYFKVILNGNNITEILVKTAPLFDVKEFADLVEKSLNLRPGDVKVYEEAGVVTVLEKIKVTEAGVEGSGPLAQRVFDIYNEYVSKKRKENK
ncbi:MAG: Sm-like ribonucleoprotein core [Candidatus Aramenus sulfurataquae]|jgi:small nuclear ribonucleoprotein (snRNP)-like protein|uniref:Lsm family RNA-binding protein n=2 Tax=Candidatus Aramenus sulfurataquae TaxID=1326980 RepID=W7KIU3_9CREN|nr:MAG: Sm-like ribonucleoprotein core [Candidatus Aramenus sulfurataquae]MCL7343365.1 Lsm family RNA-binding protein [Candidatus Aramenus sulfurataquae]